MHEYIEQAGTAFLPDKGITASDPRIGAFPQTDLVRGWKIGKFVAQIGNSIGNLTGRKLSIRSATISVAFP